MNAGMNTSFTGRSGLAAWWYTMCDGWRPPTLASWSGGLGLAAFALGLPAVIIYISSIFFTKERLQHLIIIILAILLVVLIPAQMIARFDLIYLAFMGMAIGWLCCNTGVILRIGIYLCLLSAMCYNVYITAPCIFEVLRVPEVLAFNLMSGYSRSGRMEKMPDNYDAIDFWLDNVGIDKSYSLAIPESMAPWFFTNPKTKSGIVRVKMYDPAKETIGSWITRLKNSGATHAFVPRDTPGFNAAVSSPNELSLIYDRFDSGSRSIVGAIANGQSALFTILHKGGT
jgi:hypothetical protein